MSPKKKKETSYVGNVSHEQQLRDEGHEEEGPGKGEAKNIHNKYDTKGTECKGVKVWDLGQDNEKSKPKTQSKTK